MIAEIHDNQHVYLTHITDTEDQMVWVELSVSKPNRYVDPTQLGNWDGIFRKYNRLKKRFARPLLQFLEKACEKHNVPIRVVDKRDAWGYEVIDPESINEDFLPGIKLEDYQINAIRQACLHECGIVDVPTGGGKCLGRGTKVLMYDGTIKNVEEVVTGDLLMGDDSRPRTVLSTTSGMDNLYKVEQINGDDYIVNSEHILTLYRSKSDIKRDHTGRTLVDINIEDYMSSSKWMKHILKGIKAPVEFTEKALPIDPYILGLWLGDGRATDMRFFLQPHKDIEIIKYLTEYCNNNGYVLVEYPEKSDCVAYNIRLYEGLHRNEGMTGILQNDLKASFRELDLLKNKHVPAIFKTSSREQRLQLLAGFIDADGHAHHSGYDITVKNNEIVDGIVFIARSLGFRVTLNERYKQNTKTGKGDIYAYIGIYGNTQEIPVKVQYKKCEARKSKKNPLVCGIKVSHCGYGEYYGFEIDGNKRFLLGDFTITHNTEVISGICKAIKCPTVILADQTVIIDQIKQRLELRDVTEEVGLFYAGKKPDGQLIVVGSIQSISPPTKYPEMPIQKHNESDKAYSKRYDTWDKRVQAFKTRKKNAKVLQKYVHDAEMLIVDEADKAVSEQWKALFRYHFKGRRRYGVTGTPFDKSKPVEAVVLQEHLGSVIAKETRARLTELGRIIPCEYFMLAYGLDGSIHEATAYDEAYDEHITNSVKYSNIIKNICKKYCVNDDGTLIIVDREALGLRLKDDLLSVGIKAEFIYGKTPKKQRDEALRSFERRELQVLIGGKIINRGLDLAGGCETLIIASGGKLQSEFLQKIGRALRRNKYGKSRIFDFYFRCNKYLYQHSKARMQTIIEAGYPVKIVLPGGLMDGTELVRNRWKIANRYLNKS